MKKLLFVLAFAFIGQQAFSQMYMAILFTLQLRTSQDATPTQAQLTPD